MRLCLAVVLLSNVLPVGAFAEDSCGFLYKRTQAFSDAGQSGDGAAMARMLDPDVIFYNETGEKASRADMASAVLEQGSSSEMKFRSVETWRKESTSWKRIGTETLTLQQDPDPMALDGNALDEYAGTYEAGASMKFTFAREGNDLVASLNGGAPTAQIAQARDIFFTRGHGTTPKVFQRGENGKIAGIIYLRGRNSIAAVSAALAAGLAGSSVGFWPGAGKLIASLNLASRPLPNPVS